MCRQQHAPAASPEFVLGRAELGGLAVVRARSPRAVGSSFGQSAAGASTVPAELQGNTFVATEVTGSYTMAPGSSITLTFEDGTVSARAGCNSMSGAVVIKGDVLIAPTLASTMMACEEALMAQDTWFAAFLRFLADLDLRRRHADPDQRHRHHRLHRCAERCGRAGGDRLEAGRADLQDCDSQHGVGARPVAERLDQVQGW